MTEIEATQDMTRDEVAEYLREFASELDTSESNAEAISDRDVEVTDQRVTFMVGNDSATINPPQALTLDVEVGSDGSLVGNSGSQQVSFELGWEIEEAEDEEREPELEIK